MERVWGGFGKGLGRVLGRFGEVFGRVLAGSAGLLGAIGASQRVLGVLDRFYLVFSTSSRREARAQRASRGTKEGRVERKRGKMISKSESFRLCGFLVSCSFGFPSSYYVGACFR